VGNKSVNPRTNFFIPFLLPELLLKNDYCMIIVTYIDDNHHFTSQAAVLLLVYKINPTTNEKAEYNSCNTCFGCICQSAKFINGTTWRVFQSHIGKCNCGDTGP
jgi:hypothetical protein